MFQCQLEPYHGCVGFDFCQTGHNFRVHVLQGFLDVFYRTCSRGIMICESLLNILLVISESLHDLLLMVIETARNGFLVILERLPDLCLFSLHLDKRHLDGLQAVDNSVAVRSGIGVIRSSRIFLKR
jgi:hypothetical protein